MISAAPADRPLSAEALAAAIADWRASKPERGDRDHFNRAYLGEYGQALDACAARHGVDPDLLNQEAAERVTLLREPDEAEAERLEALAARHEPRSPDLTADFRRSADLVRHPATACRPGTRVVTDQGLCRVEEGGALTPLERPEDVERRRETLAGWEAAARESDRRIAAEDAIAARRQAPLPIVRRTAPRARGAGRPAVRSTSRSSSGDDSDPGEPPPALAGPSPRFSRPWRLAVEARVADLLGGRR